MSTLDDFFATIDCESDEPQILNAEELECTSQDLYKCAISELKADLFKSIEKETGVGLFDLRSIVASANVINVDYLLLITCRFCAESVAHTRIETCLTSFVNRVQSLFDTPFVFNNLQLLKSNLITGKRTEDANITTLLSLISDRFHRDVRKEQATISHFGLIFLVNILQNELVVAYELVFHLCHSLILSLPKSNQSWNCAERILTTATLDDIVTALSQVIQLQFVVAVLDTLGREQSKQDMMHTYSQNNKTSSTESSRQLLEDLINNGRKFILSFRSLIPTISYIIRAVLLNVSVYVRPDLSYLMLQKGYKVDWNSYLTTVQDLENSWNALIYARRHSKVDMWKSIDPDWRDEGYQFVYLVSREDSYSILKEKEAGTFMLIPQDLESDFCAQFVLTYRTTGSELYKNAIIRREKNPSWETRKSEGARSHAAEEEQIPKYFYRCGKYGPNGNLQQTLHDLAKIIPGSLRFDILLPPSLPLPGNDLFAPKLDLNMHLWLDIQQAMPRWIQTINVSQQGFEFAPSASSSQSTESTNLVFVDDLLAATDDSNQHDSDNDSDDDSDAENDENDQATSVSGDTAYTSDEDHFDVDPIDDDNKHKYTSMDSPIRGNRTRRFSSSASYFLYNNNGNNTNNQTTINMNINKRTTHPSWPAFDPEYLEFVNHAMVAMKAVMRFAEQSTSVGVLIEKLFTLDIDNMRTVYSEDDIERVQHCADHLWSCLQQKYTIPFAESLLRVLLLANDDEDECYDAIHSSVVLSLLSPLLRFLEDSDQLLREQLLPAPPPGLSMAPTLRFLPPYDQISSTFLYKATKNYYSRELYLLEKLFQSMLESVRIKTLKVPESLTGFGLTECIVPDCIAATDIMFLVTKWREMLLLDYAIKNPRSGSDIHNKTKAGSKSAGYATSHYNPDDDRDDDDYYLSPRKPSAANLSSADNKVDNKDALVYSKREWQAAYTFGNIMQLLNADIHLEPSELMHKLIFWMFSCKAIQEVIKPAEMAFSIPQIYYHYVDHWEARVLGNPNALSDRVQLGRQLFSDAGSESVNDAYNWKKRDLFALSRDALENDLYFPYSKRIAAILRASEIMQEVKRSTSAKRNNNSKDNVINTAASSSKQGKQRHSSASTTTTRSPFSVASNSATISQFGPESYLARNERRQDWTYHFLQLYELLQVEDYVKKMIAYCHLYHMDVEQFSDKLAGATSAAAALTATSNPSSPCPPAAGSSSVSSIPGVLSPPLPTARSQQERRSNSSNNNLLTAAANYNNPTASGLWQGSSLAQSPYITTMNQFLYKNALFARLLLPHRYVAFIQVDLYSLKEILGVAPRQTNSSSNSNNTSNASSSATSGIMAGIGGGAGDGSMKPPSMSNLASFFGAATNPSVANTSSHRNHFQSSSTQQQQAAVPHTASVLSSAISTTASAMAHAAMINNSSSSGGGHHPYSSSSSSSATSPIPMLSATTTQQKVFGANMGQSVMQHTLTITPSSTSMHHTSGMDVYAVIRLVKTSIDQRNSRDGNGLKGLFPSSKVHIDGSCITPVSKAEPLPGASGVLNNANNSFSSQAGLFLPPRGKPTTAVPSAGNNSGSGNGNGNKNESSSTNRRIVGGGKYSRHILAQVSVAVDFEWRNQGIFRFALPEGWLTLLQEEMSMNMEGGNIGRQDIRSPPAMKIHIFLYERSFFADSALGEVEIPLEDMTEKNTVRDWFPVVQEKTISWMLYAQAKLRFQLMKTESPVVGGGTPHHAAGAAQSPVLSATSNNYNSMRMSPSSSSSSFTGAGAAGGAGAGASSSNTSSAMGMSMSMGSSSSVSAFSAAPNAAAAAITDAIGALKHNKRFEAFANLADRFRAPSERSVAGAMIGISSSSSSSSSSSMTNQTYGSTNTNPSSSSVSTAEGNAVPVKKGKIVIAAPTKPVFTLDAVDNSNKPAESKEKPPLPFTKKIEMKKPANFIEDLLNR